MPNHSKLQEMGSKMENMGQQLLRGWLQEAYKKSLPGEGKGGEKIEHQKLYRISYKKRELRCHFLTTCCRNLFILFFVNEKVKTI